MLFAYCFGVMQRDLNDRGWGQITVSAWWYKASIISCLTAISIDDVTATKIKRAYTAVNRLKRRVWFPRRSYESVVMNLKNDNTGSGNNFYQISVNVCNVFFAWYRCLQRYCTTATYMDRQRIKYVSWHLARAVAGVKTTRDVLKLRLTRILSAQNKANYSDILKIIYVNENLNKAYASASYYSRFTVCRWRQKLEIYGSKN